MSSALDEGVNMKRLVGMDIGTIDGEPPVAPAVTPSKLSTLLDAYFLHLPYFSSLPPMYIHSNGLNDNTQ